MKCVYLFIYFYFRTVQVQVRGCGGSGRLPQWDPKVELCVQKKANSDYKHRQEHRKGPSASGRERVPYSEHDK